MYIGWIAEVADILTMTVLGLELRNQSAHLDDLEPLLERSKFSRSFLKHCVDVLKRHIQEMNFLLVMHTFCVCIGNLCIDILTFHAGLHFDAFAQTVKRIGRLTLTVDWLSLSGNRFNSAQLELDLTCAGLD